METVSIIHQTHMHNHILTGICLPLVHGLSVLLFVTVRLYVITQSKHYPATWCASIIKMTTNKERVVDCEVELSSVYQLDMLFVQVIKNVSCDVLVRTREQSSCTFVC